MKQDIQNLLVHLRKKKQLIFWSEHNEQTTSKAARTGYRILNVWTDDVFDQLVTTSSTGKHSTLKQKTVTQQQRKAGDGQNVKLQKQSNRLLFVCQVLWCVAV